MWGEWITDIDLRRLTIVGQRSSGFNKPGDGGFVNDNFWRTWYKETDYYLDDDDSAIDASHPFFDECRTNSGSGHNVTEPINLSTNAEWTLSWDIDHDGDPATNHYFGICQVSCAGLQLSFRHSEWSLDSTSSPSHVPDAVTLGYAGEYDYRASDGAFIEYDLSVNPQYEKMWTYISPQGEPSDGESYTGSDSNDVPKSGNLYVTNNDLSDQPEDKWFNFASSSSELESVFHGYADGNIVDGGAVYRDYYIEWDWSYIGNWSFSGNIQDATNDQFVAVNFLWTPAELERSVPRSAQDFKDVWDGSSGSNFQVYTENYGHRIMLPVSGHPGEWHMGNALTVILPPYRLWIPESEPDEATTVPLRLIQRTSQQQPQAPRIISGGNTYY